METYQGRIETLNDALVIFEACQQGILHRTTRRLLKKEKEELRGGKVYVFDETESGIRRWTDGRLWGPSKIIKDFLVYHELATRDRDTKRHEPLDESLQKRITTEELKMQQCSKGTFLLRKNGLLKKTLSIKFNGTYQHMVIYEDAVIKDPLAESLLPPQAFEELRCLQPREDILNSKKMPKISMKNLQKKRKGRQTHRLLPKQLSLAQTEQRQQNYQSSTLLESDVLIPEQTYVNDTLVTPYICTSDPYGSTVLLGGDVLIPEQTYVNDTLITPYIGYFNPYGVVNLTVETPLLWSLNQPINFNNNFNRSIISTVYPSVCSKVATN